MTYKQNIKYIDIGNLSLEQAERILEDLKYKMIHKLKYKKPKPIKPKWWN